MEKWPCALFCQSSYNTHNFFTTKIKKNKNEI
jgi:hypothetical protein